MLRGDQLNSTIDSIEAINSTDFINRIDRIKNNMNSKHVQMFADTLAAEVLRNIPTPVLIP